MSYICFSPARMQTDAKGNKLGYGSKRALFYTSYTQAGVFRKELEAAAKEDLLILTFNTFEAAQVECDRINDLHGDNFTPIQQ